MTQKVLGKEAFTHESFYKHKHFLQKLLRTHKFLDAKAFTQKLLRRSFRTKKLLEKQLLHRDFSSKTGSRQESQGQKKTILKHCWKVIFLPSKHPIDAAVPLQAAITALLITKELRRPRLQTHLWRRLKQPLQCHLRPWIIWIVLSMRPSASRTHRTDKIPPIDAGSHFMRENTGFHAISNVQTSPWRSNSTAICYHCLANHTRIASTKAAHILMKQIEAAIALRSARLNCTWQWRTRPSASRTRCADKVSPIDTESHFARESTQGVVRSPNIICTQQFHCHLQSWPCKSQWNCVDQPRN